MPSVRRDQGLPSARRRQVQLVPTGPLQGIAETRGQDGGTTGKKNVERSRKCHSQKKREQQKLMRNNRGGTEVKRDRGAS